MEHQEAVELVQNMTEEELMKKFWDDYGYRSGPITISTRSVYEKKMINYLKSGPSSTPTSSSTPSTASRNLKNGDDTPSAPSTPVTSRKTGSRKSLPVPSPKHAAVRFVSDQDIGTTTVTRGIKSNRCSSPSKSTGLRLSLVSFAEPLVTTVLPLDSSSSCDTGSSSSSKTSTARDKSPSRRRVTLAAPSAPFEPTVPKLSPTVGRKKTSSRSSKKGSSHNTSSSSSNTYRLNTSSSEEEDETENHDVLSELPMTSRKQGLSSSTFYNKSISGVMGSSSPGVMTSSASTGVSPSATGRMPQVRTSTPIVSSGNYGQSSGGSRGSLLTGDRRTSSRISSKSSDHQSLGSSPFVQVVYSDRKESFVTYAPSASGGSFLLDNIHDDNNHFESSENDPLLMTKSPNDSSSIASNLMRYRRFAGNNNTTGNNNLSSINATTTRNRRGAGSSGSASSTSTLPLSSITTQSTDQLNQGMVASKGLFSSFLSFSTSSTSLAPVTSSYNWISCSILVLALCLLGSVVTFYAYSRYNASTSPVVPLEASSPSSDVKSSLDEDLELLASKIKAPLCSERNVDKLLCLKSRDRIIPVLNIIEKIRGLFEKNLIEYNCGSSTNDSETTDATTTGEKLLKIDPTMISVDELKKILLPGIMSSKFVTDALNEITLDQSASPHDEELKRHKIALTLFNEAIILIQLNQERFKMIVLKDIRSKETNIVSHIRIDPHNFPVRYPIMCKIKMGIYNFLMVAGVAAGVLITAVSIFYVVNIQRKKRTAEEELFYDLIEKSLELLQSPDEPQSMPISHIRDTLLSPLERKDQNMLRIWNRVVDYIESSESRVTVRTEDIDGESYRSWKWVASPSVSLLEGSAGGSHKSDPGTIKTGGIEWQGQAFNESIEALSPRYNRKSGRLSGDTSSTSETVPFTAPTPFLKIRNMFDPDTIKTKGSVFQSEIKNAIIEKCLRRMGPGVNSGHGILHIHVDEDHAKDGLVFLRCIDLVTASNTYMALHGWWCEKRLVSVRFLHSDRYYMRFPEAKNVRQELKLERIVEFEDANDDTDDNESISTIGTSRH